MPVVFVEAEDEKEAKTKLLQVNSQYGRIDIDVLQDFAADIDLDQFSLPELGKAAFIFETEKTEHGKILNLFGHKVLCSDQEQQMLKDYLENYSLERGSYLGLISRLFGSENSIDYGNFEEQVDLDSITGADYNPREIEKKKDRNPCGKY